MSCDSVSFLQCSALLQDLLGLFHQLLCSQSANEKERIWVVLEDTLGAGLKLACVTSLHILLGRTHHIALFRFLKGEEYSFLGAHKKSKMFWWTLRRISAAGFMTHKWLGSITLGVHLWKGMLCSAPWCRLPGLPGHREIVRMESGW